MNNKIKIAIEIKGGCLVGVKSNSKDIDIEIFDYDSQEDCVIIEPDNNEYPIRVY